MPRRGFVPRRMSSSDRALAGEMRKTASAWGKKVLREINLFEEFLNLNPSVREESFEEAYLEFAAQWLNEGYGANTAVAMHDDLKRVRAQPRNLEPAKDAARNALYASIIKRYAALKTRPPKRRRMPSPLPGIPATRPRSQKEVDKWAFWALVCITGNRPFHVLQAIVTNVDSRAVSIYWTIRKIRCNVPARHEFQWTTVPPKWVRDRWRELEQRPWPFPHDSNIASSLGTWLENWNLKKQGVKPTSPRREVDDTLRNEVRAGRMLSTEFELLMDHNLVTSYRNYTLPGREVGQSEKSVPRTKSRDVPPDEDTSDEEDWDFSGTEPHEPFLEPTTRSAKENARKRKSRRQKPEKKEGKRMNRRYTCRT